MYLLIVILPLISAVTAGFFGRFIGREGSKYGVDDFLEIKYVNVAGI